MVDGWVHRHTNIRTDLFLNFPPTDISELERFRQSQEEEEEDGAASVLWFPSLAHEQETASLYFTPTGTPIRDHSLMTSTQSCITPLQ